MKVYVSFNIKKAPAGGGNNFLLYLVSELQKRKIYTKNIFIADIILLNSHHKYILNSIFRILFPKKILIHRLDGKPSMHRNEFISDKIIVFQNKHLANATIFQSLWSKNIWSEEINTGDSKVILNQANHEIFEYKISTNFQNGHLKCIFISWSSNRNKGSDYLQWLYEKKEELDISLKIIGNISITGYDEPIKVLTQKQIAKELLASDILFFPAMNEACSNVIVEAQAVGLPVLALNSGANGELISKSGILFNNYSELVSGIESIRNNYHKFRIANLELNKSRKSVDNYLEYFESVNKKKDSKIKPSKILFELAILLKLKFIRKINL
jgi:glycosyltransferase involved in cell wall biosynthesis